MALIEVVLLTFLALSMAGCGLFLLDLWLSG